jgi:hypothetical protein
MWLITRENKSGRNHAAENAAMPPEEAPQIARSNGSDEMLACCSTTGRISVSRNVE